MKEHRNYKRKKYEKTNSEYITMFQWVDGPITA